jgi:hypothetical protein
MQHKQANRISFDMPLPPIRKGPLERFFEYLPSMPYCMKSAKVKPYCFQLPKEKAIFYPIIQLNKLFRAYLCFDIDRQDAVSAYQSAELPEPTLIILNPKNGHSHFCYELLNPVTFTHRGYQKPKLFFLSVLEAMRVKLGGDPSFNRVLVKNPFWNTINGGKWELIINDRVYHLKTLANYAQLKNFKKVSVAKKYFPQLNQNIFIGERNDKLFHDLRYRAYRIVRNYTVFEKFYNEILIYCTSVNEQFCKPPLSNSEIVHLSKSVSTWTWDKRACFANYQKKNRGAAGLEPVSYWMEGKEWVIEKKRRQRIGAKYTHSLKRQKTEKAIIQAIEELIIDGQKVTKIAVAKKIGMTKENISRRYGYLF